MNGFTFIIDGVKLLELGNLSVAILTLITQIVIAVCAVVAILNAERIYRKQKNIDIEKYQEQQKMDQLEIQKKEVVDKLILLQSKVMQTIFIFERIDDNSKKKNYKIFNTIFEKILFLLAEVAILLEFYFGENKEIIKQYEVLDKKIGEFILSCVNKVEDSSKVNLRKESLEKISEIIKVLIKKIQKVKN